MSKRWAAWPRGIRWLAGGTAALLLALALAWALFVPAADWLAHHDVGSATGSLHETALDNARGRLLTLGAGLFAAGALVYTARNFTLSREGQVTDRYTKAIGQLGSKKKLDVRIGGIYALERVARDSARDHPTVMEVLAAFIRDHSHEQWPPSDHPARRDQEASTQPDVQAVVRAALDRPGSPLAMAAAAQGRSPRADVRAALTVIRRRDPARDVRSIDLAGADLRGADLTHADLAGADLRGADLRGVNLFDANLTARTFGHADLFAFLTRADLAGADLRGADLGSAHLDSADLTGANLTGANLEGADLTRANLSGANLTDAHLGHAHVIRAIVQYANLARADLGSADLTRATLTGATLTGAHLSGANLTDADLADARWPEGATVPEGWGLDPGSGRLFWASTGSGPTEAD